MWGVRGVGNTQAEIALSAPVHGRKTVSWGKANVSCMHQYEQRLRCEWSPELFGQGAGFAPPEREWKG